ncbi:TetR/AcrR family transcriptional regulator [Lentzea tibetensis]|uniref:TetR/AcrR family transcriptional regulator n=1 Tax=Lentzea tibetensis TaxID=2591470 RepID=A0A563EN61_9PSEU|nr:TetR/AcrR family transcriptional regulator [Lentzea tibetensis]TWP48660.1 TetR/AcrR family transcriptional regulator [Lentzea tibetensis]
MVRLTRAETQERNRARVLAAARDEFTERGFRDAKIDAIAERAELTRGAVYSNFPGKRALYFAVLAAVAEEMPRGTPGRTPREALGAFARAWVARLPLATDPAVLGADLLAEIMSDELTRTPFAQLTKLNALLLGLALEDLRPGAPMVRVAETALTVLHGASQLAAAAPGFVEPFDVVRACEELADLEFDERPPVPPMGPPVRPVDEPWAPPPSVDLLDDAGPFTDGVITVLGLHRASAVEDAVRTGEDVTLVLVSAAPGELMPLARLAIAEMRGYLRQSVAWSPRLRIVCDPAFAAAAGVPSVSDATETAVRVRDGRIVARSDGWGACQSIGG